MFGLKQAPKLPMTEVTRILSQIESGDPSAAEKLLPLLYNELRVLATQRLAHEKPGHSLQATALVHEAYIRLVGSDRGSEWDSRGHFFAAAAEAMRRILVESARRKQTAKRGGDLVFVELVAEEISGHDRDRRLISLDEALSELEKLEPAKAVLVKLRYFAGMTNKQAAGALGISTNTADRYWAFARAWLKRHMDSTVDPGRK